jgi:signal transduction histidine kinase
MVRRWTLSRRITTLCALAAIVLGGIAITATAAAQANREQVRDLLDRVGPLRTDAAQLSTVVVDQETGVRGFALIRSEDALGPYTRGVDEQGRLIAHMRVLTRDAGVLDQLSVVEQQTAAWRSQVAEPAIAAARSDDPAIAQPILGDAAKARFDQIRASVDDLQTRVAAVREASADRVRSTESRVVGLLILAAIVVVIAGIALATLLRQLVTRPVVDLAGEVRRVANGEYDLDIGVDGPPEVARLAADVNAMRRQIVADLATVGRARQKLEEANRQLERQAEELTRSNRDLEQFAYVASHDLQEPLRKVASFCQLLQRRYAGQLDERADQYILFAVDGAQRMQRLINDLLAFSRIGRITSGFTEVDLEKVVAESAAQLESRREQFGGQITWSGLPVVLGEEPLLAALFTNLISNSLKFRHPDRPPRIRIHAERSGDEWSIFCEDNGIGIEPEYADKIFVIFQRLHPKDQYPGTGIGLAIAKKIIEFHGGRIWLDSDDRVGTLIRFTLPVIESEPAAGDAHAPDATQPNAAEPVAGEPVAGESVAAEPVAAEAVSGAGPVAADAVPERRSMTPTEPAATDGPDLIPVAADASRAEETAE